MISMEDVYQAHAQLVNRYLLSLTHDAEVAEELTQETFYQAVKSIDRFDGSCKVSTWLCAIAKNQLAAYRRKHRDWIPLEQMDTAVRSAEQDVMRDMQRMELLQRLHRLGEPTREVMYLRLFGDLSFREIGTILSKTENWARVTFYRGKETLKKEMEAND